MLDCHGCGLTNRPYETACALCDRPLQDQAAADAKRREWDTLPPPLRADQEKVFDRMRSATDDYLRWLKNHRRLHAILGALLVCIPMNMAVFFASLWSLPIDLALGAAAALVLNRYHGGAWHGAGIFLAAAVLSVFLRLPFLNLEAYLTGVWLVTCFSICIVSVLGYYMGLKLAMEHIDHTMTA